MTRQERKIKRRRARAVFITLVLLVAPLLFYQLVRPPVTDAREPLQVVSITVKNGDTLWGIADRYDNNKMDLRKYVDLIEKYNSLEGSTLQPGQRLSIPVY